jgi:hypothetical protein
VSQIVAGSRASGRVNPGLKTPQYTLTAAPAKTAAIMGACGTMETPGCRTGLETKSIDDGGHIKKQLETNQQHQACVATALFRALDRESAIVTLLVK